VLVEPAGAAAVAAVATGKVASAGRRVAVLVCGANLDPDLAAQAVSGALAERGETGEIRLRDHARGPPPKNRNRFHLSQVLAPFLVETRTRARMRELVSDEKLTVFAVRFAARSAWSAVSAPVDRQAEREAVLQERVAAGGRGQALPREGVAA